MSDTELVKETEQVDEGLEDLPDLIPDLPEVPDEEPEKEKEPEIEYVYIIKDGKRVGRLPKKHIYEAFIPPESMELLSVDGDPTGEVLTQQHIADPDLLEKMRELDITKKTVTEEPKIEEITEKEKEPLE